MISKSALAIILSKLKVFENANTNLEQYPTDSEIAADMLHTAYMKGDVEGKDVADFGCGTGILGIGALILGARQVTFIEKDPHAIKILEENLEYIEDEYDLPFEEYEIKEMDIEQAHTKCDTVIQNPPFGSQTKHADKIFLEKAIITADIIYSLHMAKTESFLRKFSEDNNYKITDKKIYKFPLKNTMKHHTKKKSMIDVICIRMNKKLWNNNKY